MLSQLTRPSKDIKQPKPTMHSLKESGGLEADGDVILLLYRPYVLGKDNPEISPTTSDIVIAKNKFGLTGQINLHFDGKHQIFREIGRWVTTDEEIPKQWQTP